MAPRPTEAHSTLKFMEARSTLRITEARLTLGPNTGVLDAESNPRGQLRLA